MQIKLKNHYDHEEEEKLTKKDIIDTNLSLVVYVKTCICPVFVK